MFRSVQSDTVIIETSLVLIYTIVMMIRNGDEDTVRGISTTLKMTVTAPAGLVTISSGKFGVVLTDVVLARQKKYR
jgi:hypothetical protein